MDPTTEEDIKRYRKLIEELARSGITPFVVSPDFFGWITN